MGKTLEGALDPVQNLEQIKVSGDNSSYTWEFWRDRETGDQEDLIMDCNNQTFISFAFGTTEGESILYHGDENRGNILITMEKLKSIFPAPIVRGIGIWDVLTRTTIGMVMAAPVLMILLSIVACAYGKKTIIKIIVGVLLSFQDAVSDYVLVGEWYYEGNYWWGTFMLLSVILGGIVTVYNLWGAKTYNATKFKKIHILLDVFGFAFLRLAFPEYKMRLSTSQNPSLEAPDSESDENSTSVVMSKDTCDELDGEGSENSKPLDKEDMEKLEDQLKKKVADQRKELRRIILAKVSGNLLESLLSFSLVSYYLIIGTVSSHPDVQRPSRSVYLS